MGKPFRYLIPIAVIIIFMGGLIGCQSTTAPNACIDRQKVVLRNNVLITQFDTLGSLSVGNGSFAFTVDATGLQTFPEAYENGVSLGTQSDWGWHSYLNEANFKPDEAIRNYDVYGRQVGYAVQWETGDRREMAANYYRMNPHRLHLGNVGFEMTTSDGTPVKIGDISNVEQTLNMWEGKIKSRFVVDGQKVEVWTYCHPNEDVISVRVKSALITTGQLAVNLRFPYPTGKHTDAASDWTQAIKHQSLLKQISQNRASITRMLDTTNYVVDVAWQGKAKLKERELHHFVLKSKGSDELLFSVRYSSKNNPDELPAYKQTQSASVTAWQQFWQSGAFVDFGECTDKRAPELERRVVLSQYLTRIQCAGIYPPQETGLTFNSWFGKFHLEMDWWHGVHFALWNRIDLLEKRLGWYQSVYKSAADKAQKQGYEGVRWAKMTNPNGADSPSSIGEFLIWQQPHIIYFAELCYRHYNDSATLARFAPLVFATADFMASYAHWDEATTRYILGPVLIPAQECFNPETTINPPFELAYWRWGLSTALAWQERMGLPANPGWKKVLDGLSPLPANDHGYLVAENAPDTYTNAQWQNDHPMILGVYGMLPATNGLDTTKMAQSVNFIKNNWNWAHTWGWDYPMAAMNAARMNQPNWALDALLMEVQKNRYLVNGHNFQDERLRIYLPGNGGLLTAVAMMCAGFDGNETANPGFPKDGTWNVKWEGFAVMP